MSGDEDDDRCPDCGFETERNVLVRTEDSAERPCPACLWAHEPPRCPLCFGSACEKGCGDRFGRECRWKHAGPDSHKVCRRCGGSGQEVPR